MDAYGPEVERQMRRLFNSLGEKDEKKDRCTDESQEPSSVMTASGRASSRARNERVGGNAPQAALLSWGAPGRISAYTGNRTTS